MMVDELVLAVSDALGGKPLDTTKATEQIYQYVPMVLAFVGAYTRRRGFTEGEPNEELSRVVISATARMLATPLGVRGESQGPFSVQYVPTVEGFTLLELVILNRYRTRAQ